MRARWQTGAAANERLEATSPITAITLFWLINFWTAVTASSGRD